MVAVGILAFSIVGLLRFALSYWRAILAGAAAESVSEELRSAANLEGKKITGRDFDALAGVHCMTPDGSSGLGFVGVYYRIAQGIGGFAKRVPGAAAWAEREMTACAQYVGVRVDRSLKASLVLPQGA